MIGSSLLIFSLGFFLLFIKKDVPPPPPPKPFVVIEESIKDSLQRKLDIQIADQINNLSPERKEQLKKLANHDLYSIDISVYGSDPLLGKKIVDHTYFYIYSLSARIVSPDEILEGKLKETRERNDYDLLGQARICENTPKKDLYGLEYCPGNIYEYEQIKTKFDKKIAELHKQKNKDIVGKSVNDRDKIDANFEKDLKNLEEKRYLENKKNEGKSWRVTHGDTGKNNLLDDNNWKEEISNYYELTEKQKNNPKFTLVAKPLYVSNSKFTNYEKIPMGPKNNRNVGFSGDLGTLLK